MNGKKTKAAACGQKSLGKRIWKARWSYAALIPTFAFLFTFTLYPALLGIYRSLFRWKTNNYFTPKFAGVDNYVRLLGDSDFWESFGVLLVFIVWGFINTFVINFSTTYFIFRLKDTRAGRFFKKAFVVPMMIPAMVGTMYWSFFYKHDTGILDAILNYLGKEEWIHIWLADNRFTLPAMLFKGFPWAGGFAMLIFLAGFLNVDTALEEAMQIDGANAWDVFTRLYLPLSIPQIKLLSVLGMIGGLQDYTVQIVYTQGRYHTMVPAYAMYQNAFENGNYGYATAQGTVLFLIILIITILQQKYIKKADE